MKRYFLLLIITLHSCIVWTQNRSGIRGKILELQTEKAILSAEVAIEGLNIKTFTEGDGTFVLATVPSGKHILKVSIQGFREQRIPVSKVPGQTLDMGILFLEKDLASEQIDAIITLTENDLSDDSGSDGIYGLLQATRDIYLTRAAFDFSQVFFRVRNYGGREATVLLNGLPMNEFFNGRPQWNNWGGLNDITRNQEFTNSLTPSAMSFGSLVGVTNINLRAGSYRSGMRFSSSASNRTYSGRVMATYHSGMKPSGLAYSVSASGRWAENGFIEGTPYDAYSLFVGLEFKPWEHSSFTFNGIFASNRRGQSTAVTDEVFQLAGQQYNPHWGKQSGEVRNSRIRTIEEPILIANYFYETEKLNINVGVAWQTGKFGRTRLAHFNAPNPSPVYFRYLPSNYINSGSGNFENANLAKERFQRDPQLNWDILYQANRAPALNGKSAYLVQEDRTDDSVLTAQILGNLNISQNLRIDAGITYRGLESDNYARIDDLLGASYHEDIDPFTDTRNDLNGEINKTTGNRFNYNYILHSTEWYTFVQSIFTVKKWEAFLSASLSATNYQREGLFLNELFSENSLGESEQLTFSSTGLKGGVTYRIDSRNALSINAAYLQRPPLLQNTFINPRENNEVVPDLVGERIWSGDITYFLRWARLKGRITGYYTNFENQTDVSFFFVNSGLGSDFVQEVTSGIHTLHYGTELGLEYQFSPDVTLTAVASLGKAYYTDAANVTINFDTSGDPDELINLEGSVDLGKADITGYRLPSGPQSAFSLGMEYRDPKFWWIATTANFLTENYISISNITRTQSFLINPETQEPFPEATPDAVQNLLQQEQLEPVYLLNVVGGKSWRLKKGFISFFASVNNLFDLTYRTGGFEQNRNGNFGQLTADLSRGNPSFGPRYWFGFGRTFFANLAYNF